MTWNKAWGGLCAFLSGMYVVASVESPGWQAWVFYGVSVWFGCFAVSFLRRDW
jgi:hypothetical protein